MTKTKMMKSKLIGVLSEEMMIKLGANGENWKSLDEKIIKQFNIPKDRYYSIVLVGARGSVFIDLTRKREYITEKISKSK